MTHKDYFVRFFQIHRRGTARQICDFLIGEGANFNC